MIQLGMNEESLGNQEASSPEEDNSFHTPQHSQGNLGSVWNFIASQDSMDVFHDAHSIICSNKFLHPSPTKRRHASSTAYLDHWQDSSSYNMAVKGPLARIRHCSYGSKSCNTSPLHKTTFSTNSLRKQTPVEVPQVPVFEMQRPAKEIPAATEVNHLSTSTQTNQWMKNYVPCVEIEAFLFSDACKKEDIESTALLHSGPQVPIETYSLKKIRRKRGCLHRIKDEFQLENSKLNHKSPHLFVTSQWQKANDMSCLYLAYRLFWGAYFCLWSVWSCAGFNGADADSRKYYLIYFTNWSIWLLAFDTMLQAINVISHMRKISMEGNAKYSRMKASYQASWVLSNITTSTHIFTTLIFWSVLASRHEDPYSLIGIHIHIVPCIYVMLDLLVSAMPRQILHFYQPMLFMTVYGVFTDIYYLAGGTTSHGSRSIYHIIDWSKPAQTLLIASGLVLLFIPALHSLVVCVIYAFRLKVWKYFYHDRYLSNDSMEDEKIVHHEVSREEKV